VQAPWALGGLVICLKNSDVSVADEVGLSEDKSARGHISKRQHGQRLRSFFGPYKFVPQKTEPKNGVFAGFD
jgi:hypothetical protein